MIDCFQILITAWSVDIIPQKHHRIKLYLSWMYWVKAPNSFRDTVFTFSLSLVPSLFCTVPRVVLWKITIQKLFCVLIKFIKPEKAINLVRSLFSIRSIDLSLLEGSKYTVCSPSRCIWSLFTLDFHSAISFSRKRQQASTPLTYCLF